VYSVTPVSSFALNPVAYALAGTVARASGDRSVLLYGGGVLTVTALGAGW
jgi:hypothetical protein